MCHLTPFWVTGSLVNRILNMATGAVTIASPMTSLCSKLQQMSFGLSVWHRLVAIRVTVSTPKSHLIPRCPQSREYILELC